MVQVPPPPPPPFLPPIEQTRKDLLRQHEKIQIVIFLTFVIFTLILALGRVRYRGNNTMKQFSNYLFMITAYLISYIPGLTDDISESNELYVFWIAFLAYLAAIANEISSYTLGDNEDRKKRLIVDYFVVWPLILESLRHTIVAPVILVPIVMIFWIVVLKLRERSSALLCATTSSNGIAQTSQVISDYDKHHLKSNPSSYDYLVGVRDVHDIIRKKPLKKSIKDLEPSEFITLQRVMDFLSRTKQGNELQDTCFSFAMFWLLLARVGGYDKVDMKIFRDGNLSEKSFDLVERELEFLYEYLFTNSYAIYARGSLKKVRDVLVLALFLLLAAPLLLEYHAQDYNIVYVSFAGYVLDIGFTRFVILGIITIELSQLGLFLTSKWAKVMYLCSYLKNERVWSPKRSKFVEKVIKLVYLAPRPRISCFGMCNGRKLSQYSILDCHGTIPCLFWANCWIGRYFELPSIGQAGKWSVKLTPDLHQAVLTFIEKNRGEFTDGVGSLRNNLVNEHLISVYVTKHESQARVIIIWHIATCLLENQAKEQVLRSKNDNDFSVATKFSNYCAYLVAFIPKMLPDHVYTTKCDFDEVVTELMQEIEEDAEDPGKGLKENSIVEQGRSLKRELEALDNPDLWSTLAEFWTEKLLFLALSDHDEVFEAHADGLCVGGEFITHLWALLTHAGCRRKSV